MEAFFDDALHVLVFCTDVVGEIFNVSHVQVVFSSQVLKCAREKITVSI